MVDGWTEGRMDGGGFTIKMLVVGQQSNSSSLVSTLACQVANGTFFRNVYSQNMVLEWEYFPLLFRQFSIFWANNFNQSIIIFIFINLALSMSCV